MPPLFVHASHPTAGRGTEKGEEGGAVHGGGRERARESR